MGKQGNHLEVGVEEEGGGGREDGKRGIGDEREETRGREG